MLLGASACAFDSSGFGGGSGAQTDGAETTTTSATSAAHDHGLDSSAQTAASASHDGSTSASSDTTVTGEHGTRDTDDTDDTGGKQDPWCDAADLDLVACFDFEDLAMDTLIDGSSHGNHGTATGVGLTGGPLGQAVSFDENSRVEVPDSDSLNLTHEMTLEVWIRIDELPTTTRVGVLDNDGQYSIFLFRDTGLRCSGSGHYLYLYPVPTHTWMHVACVAGDGVHRMYVDGKLIDETSFAGPMNTGNTNPMAIGDDSPNFDQPLAGAIGGVRIWSRPLNESEVCAAAGQRCGESR
jgi:hypothetical protein